MRETCIQRRKIVTLRVEGKKKKKKKKGREKGRKKNMEKE